MQRRQIRMASLWMLGVLLIGIMVPTTGFSQTPLQHVEQQLREKQQAAQRHLQQMNTLTDPTQLAVETQRHLQLTNEILALLQERQTLLAEQALRSGAPASASPAPSRRLVWDEPKRGAPGGVLRGVGKDPRTQ
jgi:hypothetical protein